MHLEEFDYSLPEERIAQHPTDSRDGSRLLICRRASGERLHSKVSELATELSTGDVLVVNRSRVIPARLFGKTREGREIEVFLLEPHSEKDLTWRCLVRPGRKIRGETEIQFPAECIGVVKRLDTECFQIRFEQTTPAAFSLWLEQNGRTPLPPYIKREPETSDRERYQTIFAQVPGSVAAPTAGLHFSEELVKRLQEKGVVIAPLTLHVDYGTFQPLTAQHLESGELHAETYEVPQTTWDSVQRARNANKRILAVGTTSFRALESVPITGLKGQTRLLVAPGYQPRVVTGLLTNFHLPLSSLYVLVSAFYGLENTKKAYETAITQKYRFYSYGDAMLVL